jgi:plastocyanin
MMVNPSFEDDGKYKTKMKWQAGRTNGYYCYPCYPHVGPGMTVANTEISVKKVVILHT